MTTIVLALDAMGGDDAPAIVIDGAALACNQYSNISFLIFGDEGAIAPYMQKHPKLKEHSQIIHTDEVVTNDTKVMEAFRALRKSSMRLAIQSVSDGRAVAVVSAGNTGAYMALSKVILKTLEGVDRPAIATSLPTMTGRPCVTLDLGANLECSAENLVEFAVMGDVFARHMLNISNPRVGLINIGSEELKGNDVVQLAAQRMRERSDLNFKGFAEGNDIVSGKFDVVVTDGFTGNVALKTMEGTARFIVQVMRESILSSFMGKIAYLIGRSAFKKMKDRLDPRFLNGAAFLGLRGLAIKSHGGTDAVGFANAISVAIRLATWKQTQGLSQDIENRLRS